MDLYIPVYIYCMMVMAVEIWKFISQREIIIPEGNLIFFLDGGGGIEIQESLKTNNTFHIIIFLTMGWNK